MSFKQIHTTKIIRTVYEVGFFIGESAEEIQKDFAKVPKDVKMADWDDGDIADSWSVRFKLDKTD